MYKCSVKSQLVLDQIITRCKADTTTENKWKGKNVLLFGSEGFGLRTKTLMHSDFQFKVNISKNMESLNISNTVSIVCHYIKNQIKTK